MLKDDLRRVAEWSKILDDPETLSKTMTENYLSHKAELDGDGNRLLMFWDTPQYYEAGL